jgi:hypothetical protein
MVSPSLLPLLPLVVMKMTWSWIAVLHWPWRTEENFNQEKNKQNERIVKIGCGINFLDGVKNERKIKFGKQITVINVF